MNKNNSIIKTTIQMGIPIMISQIVVFLNVFFDTFYVSSINKQSTMLVTATGLVFPLMTIFLNLCQAILVGVSSITSRLLGEGNKKSLNEIGASSIFMSTILAFILMVLAYIFYKPAINLLAGDQVSRQTIEYAGQYFAIIIPGMGLNLVIFSLYGMLQGGGRMGLFGILAISSSIFNILIDPFFIYVLGWGIKGAAFSTSAGNLIPLLLYFILNKKSKEKPTVPVKLKLNLVNGDIIKEIIKIGLITSSGMFLLNFSSMVINNSIGSISEAALNAWVLVGRMDQLFLIPSFAIGLATIPMIGSNFGKKNYEECTKIAKTNLVLCLSVCTALGILYIIFAKGIFSIFTNVEEVISIATYMARILAVTTIAVAGSTVIGCSLQGAGKAIPGLVGDIIRTVLSVLILLVPVFATLTINTTIVFIVAGNLISFISLYIYSRLYFNKLKKMAGSYS